MAPDTKSQSVATAPDRETDDAVYSNFDHALDEDVVAILEADSGVCAQHAAWDFCGYVWRDAEGRWFNEVWRYKAPVETFEGETVRGVIEEANDRYGNE